MTTDMRTLSKKSAHEAEIADLQAQLALERRANTSLAHQITTLELELKRLGEKSAVDIAI
jgi:hypothetical protein